MINKPILHKFLLVCCIALLPFAASAQGWLWGRGNTGSGMDAWGVATDPAGNVFAAGFSFDNSTVFFGTHSLPYSAGTGWQVVVVKYDPNGNFLWAVPTLDSNAWLMNIATDDNGNVFVLGSFSGEIKIGSFTLNNTTGNTQYFLAKIDANGNVLWALNAGNAQFNGAQIGNISYALGCGGIATDGSGNVYITVNFHLPSVTIGSFTLTNTDPSGNTDDILIAKYNSSGTVLWAKSIGCSGNDDAYGLTVTLAGDIYIAGNLGSPTLTFGSSVITNSSSGNQSAFIGRFNSSGNPVWASASGGKRL